MSGWVLVASAVVTVLALVVLVGRELLVTGRRGALRTTPALDGAAVVALALFAVFAVLRLHAGA